VNSFELPGRVAAYNQLEDGQVLWQILSDIDADYFSESLPNFDESHRRTSDNWIPRWQNLKHIERSVSTYIREECEQLPVLTKRMIPDLKSGARDGSMMLTAKLTMAVCLASLYSPKSNERMIRVMSQMERGTAQTIAEAIQDLQSLDSRMASLGVEHELTPEPHLSGYRTPRRAVSGAGAMVERDTGLEQEAQLFEANKDRGALRTQLQKAQAELERSKGRISQLEEELVEARLHLDVHGGDGHPSHDVEQLRNDLTRDRQYIDQLETDLANAKDILESQKRRLDRLQKEEGSKQELRDQLQLLRAERDELNQKAKANENLKKKIHTLTQETRTLETLRQDYQIARERLQELETIEERCQSLEKVNKENSQTLVNCEQSIFEEKGKRSRVEHDNLLLMKQLEQTRELQYKADDAKRELEDRIRDLESSSHAGQGGSLEDELIEDEKIEEVEEPPSAKALTDVRVNAESIVLQQKVDVLNARLKSLEMETLKQMQENIGLKSDIMNVRDEESQRYVSLLGDVRACL
jgi:protein HOOK3